MRAGELRNRISIYRPSDVKDEYGESDYSLWSGGVYCAINVKDSSEQALGSETSAGTYVDFKLRYSRSLEMDYQDMIIMFRGREYEITGVRNVGFRDKELIATGVHYADRKRINL